MSDKMSDMISKANVPLSVSMERLNLMTKRILFLVNDANVLVGSLTDGDVRRYILAGGKIEDESIKAANCMPVMARDMQEAIDLFQDKYLVVPIVDEKGEIRDYFEGDRLERIYSSLRLPVVINAGGKGKRLEPLTKVLPKPLIPIGDIPIIELIMREYIKYDCTDFHIIVNYKKELLKAYFGESDSDYSLSWYDEDKPLGTGGGLGLLRGKLDRTFFFVNCDVLLLTDYNKIVNYHKQQGNIITMVCARKSITIPYGVVETGSDGIIEEMKEKPSLSFLTNTGVYIVEPKVVEDICDQEVIDFPDVIERERNRGMKVGAYPVPENDWMDMGQFSELEKMRMKLYGE